METPETLNILLRAEQVTFPLTHTHNVVCEVNGDPWLTVWGVEKDAPFPSHHVVYKGLHMLLNQYRPREVLVRYEQSAQEAIGKREMQRIEDLTDHYRLFTGEVVSIYGDVRRFRESLLASKPYDFGKDTEVSRGTSTVPI